MKTHKFKIPLLMSAMIVIIAACNMPGTSSSEATEPAATGEAVAATATEAPATESPATEAPSIQHNVVPPDGLPEEQSGQAADFDSSQVLEKKTSIGGDRFTFGRFERPFNANTMDVYFSELDIVNTMVYQDDTWIFASISLNELKAASSGEKYAVEIDDNLNGKGDWLIIGLRPQSTDWSVDGVQIYQDANHDVGAELPMLTDEGSVVAGDGFEMNVFDQGQGNDPDSAWVRISPDNPNVIEFAIKKSALANPSKFLINMWAGASLDPAKFDINDQFTHVQAGAADAGLNLFYPIKEVAEIDNSCRMAMGFQPTGSEPGLCAVFIPQEFGEPVAIPGAPACVQQSCTAQYTWNPATCSCEFSGPR